MSNNPGSAPRPPIPWSGMGQLLADVQRAIQGPPPQGAALGQPPAQQGTPALLSDYSVPWAGGAWSNLSLGQSDLWGQVWYGRVYDYTQNPQASGVYLIENNCDAYVVCSPAPIAPGAVSGPGLRTFPPYAAGYYLAPAPVFAVTAICYGVDFTTARVAPGPNGALAQARGPLASLAVTPLPAAPLDLQTRSLRSGYERIYDWYDLTAPPHSAVSVAAGSNWISRKACGLGATEVIAMVAVGNGGSAKFQVTLTAQSPSNASYQSTLTSTAQLTSSGPVTLNAQAPVGDGLVLALFNEDALNTITVSDAFIALSMA